MFPFEQDPVNAACIELKPEGWKPVSPFNFMESGSFLLI